MTQLDNKSSFNLALENYADQSETYIALLDIDNFDHLNRAYGEAVGDKMIKLTAEVALRPYFPKPKGLCLARVGGKEFAVLFKANDANDAKFQLPVRRIGVAEKGLVDQTSASLGVSVGFFSNRGRARYSLSTCGASKAYRSTTWKNRVEGHIRAAAKAS
ncbi:diguanylate cyclase [Vibrio chagasii]|nr:diguanylate cyclase [Vibrio chagasii]